eukprot:6516443-Prymnesium_polylepis.1
MRLLLVEQLEPRLQSGDVVRHVGWCCGGDGCKLRLRLLLVEQLEARLQRTDVRHRDGRTVRRRTAESASRHIHEKLGNVVTFSALRNLTWVNGSYNIRTRHGGREQ